MPSYLRNITRDIYLFLDNPIFIVCGAVFLVAALMTIGIALLEYHSMQDRKKQK